VRRKEKVFLWHRHQDGEPAEGGEGDPSEYPDYDPEDDDRLIDTFSVKDGGPIPLLQVQNILPFLLIILNQSGFM